MQLLERHFGAALSEAGKKQMDVAKLHAATVTATLNAVNAYAEWAPLSDLAKFGIINGYVPFFVYYLAQCKSWYITMHWFSLSPHLVFLSTTNSCGFLLSAPDFRLHACEFFKLVSPRYAP